MEQTMKQSKQRRRSRNNKQPAYKCIGVVVKDPNANNPIKRTTIGDLFGAFAKTLPKQRVYRYDELMEMKKTELLRIASKEGVKVWKAWNKSKISNAIIGEY